MNELYTTSSLTASGKKLLDVHLNLLVDSTRAQPVARAVWVCANLPLPRPSPCQRTQNNKIKGPKGLGPCCPCSSASSAPKTLPRSCRDSLHLHLPCPAGSPEHQPQENVSQAWPGICLCHWHRRELQQSGGGRTRARGGADGFSSALPWV